ncbi:GNAT family acetyltransferase YjcF [Alkalibacterium sp. AK22]|uniref:GNAT family N-acetyltransferase n=1 Tax=Alkalibacterium sp. AK22 TaxID=1229520 RepID=UPI00044CDDFB|nr:GNAT family N-acetyltransferase [Alkalibacterium sp. AK22]EXJ22880.1 GNAT family acetyltransferase YjcF [Alkalibacterium sp. AK22]
MKFRMTTDLDSSIYKDALDIRRAVFINEQHVEESLEIDELENQTVHLVGYLNETPCCTARLYKKPDHSLKIQRVAVLKEYRDKKLGKDLLAKIESLAEVHWQSSLMVLDSQDHAIPFYKSCGFEVSGDGFLDAGIPHHFMYKKITEQ